MIKKPPHKETFYLTTKKPITLPQGNILSYHKETDYLTTRKRFILPQRNPLTRKRFILPQKSFFLSTKKLYYLIHKAVIILCMNFHQHCLTHIVVVFDLLDKFYKLFRGRVVISRNYIFFLRSFKSLLFVLKK